MISSHLDETVRGQTVHDWAFHGAGIAVLASWGEGGGAYATTDWSDRYWSVPTWVGPKYARVALTISIAGLLQGDISDAHIDVPDPAPDPGASISGLFMPTVRHALTIGAYDPLRMQWPFTFDYTGGWNTLGHEAAHPDQWDMPITWALFKLYGSSPPNGPVDLSFTATVEEWAVPHVTCHGRAAPCIV